MKINKLIKYKLCKKPTRNKMFCNPTCSGRYLTAVNRTPSMIQSYLRVVAKITGNQMPNGAQSIIAKEVGMSRERVRQIMNDMGLIPPNKLKAQLMRKCWYCGKEKPAKGNRMLCNQKCSKEYRFYKYMQLKICEQCGKGFLAYRRGRTNGSRHGIGSTHQRFCGRICLGRFVGKKYGWGNTEVEHPTKYPKAISSLREELPRPFTIRDFEKIYEYTSYMGAYAAVKVLVKKGVAERVGGTEYLIR